MSCPFGRRILTTARTGVTPWTTPTSRAGLTSGENSAGESSARAIVQGHAHLLGGVHHARKVAERFNGHVRICRVTDFRLGGRATGSGVGSLPARRTRSIRVIGAIRSRQCKRVVRLVPFQVAQPQAHTDSGWVGMELGRRARRGRVRKNSTCKLYLRPRQLCRQGPRQV
jgi:hypothetical protein